jgi:hypothetical protein
VALAFARVFEVGVNVAVITRDPEVIGFQVHEAASGDPKAMTLRQFGILFPFEVKRTFPAAPTVAVAVTVVPLFAVVKDPREIEDSSGI